MRDCSCCSSQILLCSQALFPRVPVGERGPVPSAAAANLILYPIIAATKVQNILHVWGRIITDDGMGTQLKL